MSFQGLRAPPITPPINRTTLGDLNSTITDPVNAATSDIPDLATNSDSPDLTVSKSINSDSPDLTVSEDPDSSNIMVRTSIPSESIEYIDVDIGGVVLSIAFTTLGIEILKDEYLEIERRTKNITELTKEDILASNNKNHEDIKNTLGVDVSMDTWVECDNNCERLFKESFQYEQKTLFYLLKIITKSFITIDNSKIVFVFDNLRDLQSFKIVFVQPIGKGSEESNKLLTVTKYSKDLKVDQVKRGFKVTTSPRLIMGFGPSASGKTYNAKNVIGLLSKIDNGFPKCFLSIDGGIYRENSMTYQALVKLAPTIGIEGFSNLVITGSKEKNSLFYSTNIKNSIKELLSKQSQKLSLYVPETLSSCVLNLCMEKIQPYIVLTGDNNWVALMIYQHKDRARCPYTDDYSCKGTIESGTSREKTEGKKYSSGAWDISYSNGLYMLDRAPSYRFLIHNSGSEKPSLFYDRTNYTEVERENNNKIIEEAGYTTFTDATINNFKLSRMNRWFRPTLRGLKKYGGRTRKTQKRVKRKMR